MGITVTAIGTAAETNSAGNPSLSSVNVPAGALIVVVIYESGHLGTLSDGVNSYSSVQFGSYAANNSAYLFYAPNASLSNGTITYTKYSSANAAAISAFYATGILGSSPLDTGVTAQNTNSSASPSETSGSPAVTGELFVGCLPGYYASGTTYTQDTTNSWSTVNSFVVATNAGVGIGYQIGGLSPIIFAPMTSNAPGAGAGGIGVVAFKAAPLSFLPANMSKRFVHTR